MPLYRIARDDSWHPADLYGKEKNMTGFSSDLLQAIAKHQQIAIELLIVKGNNNLQEGLNRDRYDGILSSLPLTSTNKQYYLFSEPFFLLGPVLLVPANSTITSLAEMEGKAIGILRGSSVVFNVEEFPSLLITSYESIPEALKNLENGKVDGVILNTLPAFTYTTGLYAGTFKVASLPLTNDGLRVVTKTASEDHELIDHFNAGLKKMLEDGSYDALLHKWDLFNTLQRESHRKRDYP